MFHHHIVPVLAIALTSATAISAQEAWSRVVRGCTAPAPRGSLDAKKVEPPVFNPNADDLFAIEIESAPPVSHWVAETRRTGFTGASYYRWNGPDYFSRPGQGILRYRFNVRRAGTYQVRIHNRHDHSDSSQENDCWIRANGGAWTKAYSNTNRNQFLWNWHTNFDPGHTPVQYRLNAGRNTIEISARSRHFQIDRIHIYTGEVRNPLDKRIPQSRISRQRPVIGRPFGVVIDEPTGAANLTPGRTSAVWMWHNRGFRQDGCGLVIPGTGPNGGNGEFLLSINPIPISATAALPWDGNPIEISFRVPNDRGLLGQTFRTQALFVDASPNASTPIMLTDRLDFMVGNR